MEKLELKNEQKEERRLEEESEELKRFILIEKRTFTSCSIIVHIFTNPFNQQSPFTPFYPLLPYTSLLPSSLLPLLLSISLLLFYPFLFFTSLLAPSLLSPVPFYLSPPFYLPPSFYLPSTPLLPSPPFYLPSTLLPPPPLTTFLLPFTPSPFYPLLPSTPPPFYPSSLLPPPPFYPLLPSTPPPFYPLPLLPPPPVYPLLLCTPFSLLPPFYPLLRSISLPFYPFLPSNHPPVYPSSCTVHTPPPFYPLRPSTPSSNLSPPPFYPSSLPPSLFYLPSTTSSFHPPSTPLLLSFPHLSSLFRLISSLILHFPPFLSFLELPPLYSTTGLNSTVYVFFLYTTARFLPAESSMNFVLLSKNNLSEIAHTEPLPSLFLPFSFSQILVILVSAS